MPNIRIQKFLANSGVCSRRAAEEAILKGLVKINGEVVKEMGVKIDPEKDVVEYQGIRIRGQEKKTYIKFHKPRGIECSMSPYKADSLYHCFDFFKGRLFHVGRLDKDSSGLLLLTNDGAWSHKILHPRHECFKEYIVETYFPMNSEMLRELSKPMWFLGKRIQAKQVMLLGARRLKIVLGEGLNRQVRRMVEKVGNRVERLKRVAIGNIKLGNLEPGEWKYLTKPEILINN